MSPAVKHKFETSILLWAIIKFHIHITITEYDWNVPTGKCDVAIHIRPNGSHTFSLNAQLTEHGAIFKPVKSRVTAKGADILDYVSSLSRQRMLRFK